MLREAKLSPWAAQLHQVKEHTLCFAAAPGLPGAWAVASQYRFEECMLWSQKKIFL